MGILITLIVFILILGYTTLNLLRKNEKQEDIIEKQYNFIKLLSDTIETSSNRLNEIDEKGTFKSDDEIGWFFNEIKYIQEVLNGFIIKNNDNGG